MISGHTVLDLWKRGQPALHKSGLEPKKNLSEYYGPKRVTCDTCLGVGWLKTKSEEDSWPDRCSFCGGKGNMSLHLIAQAIDEDPGALYRLLELRVRPKTARRLLDKLLAFMEGGDVATVGGVHAQSSP